MLLRAFLRVANWLIAITGALLLVGLWWFFWRPLPRTSGTQKAPVRALVRVEFDRLGVPHIHAANQMDALFVQGYVTASERLWQMDTLRRAAAGDLSEIIGSATLQIDIATRRLRMRRIAEAGYMSLPAQDKAEMAEYARGVNYFIDTHSSNLPFEFAALQYTPKPWSVVDTILIGLYMFRDLTTSWPEHLHKAQLLASGNRAKVEYLFPVRAGDEIQPGSNAWVVSGARTQHGHPQLSNDMHLEYSIPGIWYMTSLDAPGLRVAGVALPGVPGVIVGHNQRIAWGATNLHFNVQDLYREKLDDRTGQYEFAGKMEQARQEIELIPVKGQKPVELRQWVTRHGPVILDDQGDHLALRWVANEPNQFSNPFMDVDRASNWQQFTAALSRFAGPGQNFVYADIDGNIGYHATGHLPIRRGFTGDIPLDGASGKFEWDGYVPYEQLPSAFNPSRGIIVTANQNPFPADYPYTVSGSFASPYRSRQVFDRLQAKPKLGPEDTLAIQKDVYSAFHDRLAKALVAAWDRAPDNDSEVKAAVGQLRAFNGQIDKDSPAALIVTLASHYVRMSVAESAAPGHADLYEDVHSTHPGSVAYARGAERSLQLSYAVIDRLLHERPSGWFADYDWMLRSCLEAAVREARGMQGPNVNRWRYGNYLTLSIAHPIGGKIPGLESWFNVGPVAMSGGPTTVKQTTNVLGPSERFNAVVGDWDKSLLNVVVGESGHVLSRHFKDEWEAYYYGRSFPMQFEHVDVRSELKIIPE